MELLEIPYLIIGYGLLLFTTVFMIYDFWLQNNPNPYDDLNFNIYNYSRTKFFFINFLWGAIMGHLVLGTSECYIKDPWGLIIIAIICLFMIAIGYVIYPKGNSNPFEFNAVGRALLFAAGLPFGHFLWSMNTIS